MIRRALAALAAVLGLWAPIVHAQNYVVKDGDGVPQIFCSVIVASVEYPCHALFGSYSGTPTAITAESSGALDVFLKNSSVPVTMAAQPPAIYTTASVPINISTATTTQLVALSAGKAIYVSAFDVIAAGTGNITLEYGTGSNCGTGTTALSGPYNLAAQAGISKGDGSAPVLVAPAGNALCALTSAAVQMSGSVSYAQF